MQEKKGTSLMINEGCANDCLIFWISDCNRAASLFLGRFMTSARFGLFFCKSGVASSFSSGVHTACSCSSRNQRLPVRKPYTALQPLTASSSSKQLAVLAQCPAFRCRFINVNFSQLSSKIQNHSPRMLRVLAI